ncbi:MAG TPA: hypothetical protein VNJ70_01210 [Thermoanaerobaculia bacterium]|nr:hypothetical protein [Thermoanaerobaculia bacterium]
MAKWLQSRKWAAVLMMIATLATLLAAWAIIQSGEEAKAAAGADCARLQLGSLVTRVELARSRDELDASLEHPACAPEVAAVMARRDWALLPAYFILVIGMILLLANLRLLGPPVRTGRREGQGRWWLWVGTGTALALAAVAADAVANQLLSELLVNFRFPALDLDSEIAALNTATRVKWGALAAAAFAAALLWAWRPRWPVNVPPPPPETKKLPRAVRWGWRLSWAVAVLGAAAAGVLLCGLLQTEPGRAATALRLGWVLLILFWICAFLRAVGVAAEPLARLPVEAIEPEKPVAAGEAPESAAPPPGSGYERAYPRPLWQREWALTRGRRREVGLDPDGGRVGVGLSGGGIRAATIDLGLFQGIAELDAEAGDARKGRRVLERIDFLSTVSGGGYFGSFLGRLWTRRFINGPGDIVNVLRNANADGRNVLRYLRENGRYLSPNGAGDLLQGGAAVLRNWVAVQIVLLTFLLTVFAGLQAARPGMNRVAAALPEGLGQAFALHGGFWWSPWLLLPLLAFALFVFPLGWAYWMVEPVGPAFAGSEEGRPRRRVPRPRTWDRSAIAPVAGLILVLVAALVVAGGPWRPALRAVAQMVALTAALSLFWWRYAVHKAWRRSGQAEREEEREGFGDSGLSGIMPTPEERRLDRAIHAHLAERQWLTTRLTGALLVTGVLLTLGLVDSAGQSLYVALLGPDPWSGWLAGFYSVLLMLVGYARKLAVVFTPKGGDKRPSLPVNLIAGFIAFVLVAVILVSLNAVSHAVAWRLSAPRGSAEWQQAQETCLRVHLEEDCEPVDLVSASGAIGRFPLRQGRDWQLSLLGLVTGLVLSIFFGQTFPFVNRSSHQSLYSSRLTRAYLGASNKRRWTESVTRVIRGDDCDLARYWPPPPTKAAPIHFINVTINETVGGRSQVEQKDRKGSILALGPFGMSCGVDHHAIIPLGRLDPVGREVTVFPQKEDEFRVFEYPYGEAGHRVFTGETLPLGDWIGLSGAAFSTGLGARTSLGLSLLAGFGNVRLGRWWDSGVAVDARRSAVRPSFLVGLEQFAARFFPVQVFLLDEFLARFPGTARRHWYLSDGGHFENMAGYELIRRRLPMIVIVDGEQDGSYTFGGLSNLVRKARIDFGAEVKFLNDEDLKSEIDPKMRGTVGTLEDLRLDPDTGFSKAHAALGRITYTDGAAPPSRLLYIKASLTGDEAADVLEYHRAHPNFPHEPTGDQFFDEAQWESYRKLGEHIARRLFRRPGAGAGKAAKSWWPDELV